MKNLKAALLLAGMIMPLTPLAAFGQSSPNFVNGQVPTAAQWNSYFTAKQDYFGTPAPIATSGSATDLTSGTVPFARLPLGTTLVPGALQPDGTTITVSGGIISSVGGGAAGANPTATIGASAVNGSATSFMRSDGAPKLPSTLPALDGSLLTNLNPANLSSAVPINKGGTNCTAGGVACLTAVGALTGSASSSTFLRGDGSWTTPTGSGNALFGTTTGNVSGDVVTLSNTTVGVQDSGVLLTALALNGIGGIRTSSPTITAAQFNTQCPLYTINANSLNFAVPSAATLQANGGCLVISNPSIYFAAVTPNGSDTLNGVNAALSLPPGAISTVTSDGSAADFMPVPVSLGAAQSWTKAQSNTPVTANPSGTTITLDGTSANNYIVNLTGTSAFTLANLTTITPGFGGTVTFIQPSSGGPSTISTYGSDWISPGGTSSIALSAGANARDKFSIIVDDATHVWLIPGALNGTH